VAGAKWHPDMAGELVRRRLANGSGYAIWARRHGPVRRGRKCIGFTLRTNKRSWLAVSRRKQVIGEYGTQHEAAGALYRR